MKVLILGGTGMLGHKLVQAFQDRAEVIAPERNAGFRIGWRSDVVLNAAGIVKQRSSPMEEMIASNALLPHRLARQCAELGARLIHFSTDCVFSGKRGYYAEEDIPDPQDAYGMTKLLGEVTAPALTIRTSIIGREIGTQRGLLEWFLSQRGQTVKGYRQSIFNGLTTTALAQIVVRLVECEPTLGGIWHIGADLITKYNLLNIINEVYDAGVTVEPSDEVVCDRSLDSSRFRNAIGWQPASWPDMIREMHCDAI